MTKTVFGGKFSMTGGGTMTKKDLTLEETLLHCETCKLNTMHIYKGVKGQHPNLAFLYECKECGKVYPSDKRF